MTWAELEALIAKSAVDELSGLPEPSAKRVAKRAVEDIRIELSGRGVINVDQIGDCHQIGIDKEPSYKYVDGERHIFVSKQMYDRLKDEGAI